ncbi:unnamed protein product [Pleuronectes platessa]|uniref:DUF3528 domain-containing protein n=1 Tax=Pleuronectes platessa TaxID=8262 RepID=A0A9N7V641_PLEPL|nr:unnamed protein product [Pleuronectes platessa]
MDFNERISGSNMYLPSCTYYVPGADFSGLPHYLTQSQSSCPMTYSYHQSSALPQVPSVREVAFRDYGIDSSSKWHHGRGSLSHCYTEDIMHRDGWASPTSRGGELLMKGGSSANHPSSSNPAPGFHGSVGRNGVLPQAFDQFFDTAYGGAESSTTPTAQATDADRHAARASPSAGARRLGHGGELQPQVVPRPRRGEAEQRQQ